MSKVFTITEGLENMGALRTGGQGSVYKGRRVGTIITAVKLIPTPIYTESADDKNFRNFQNEVEKLKKVNEQPNPNVVKILNSGITESGSFPFIEMEYIEGPDLEELLKPPHNPIFKIKEAIKVADQLACALQHCHKAGVRHGDIKTNNVKFNIHSGNYVLLDFGLAVMSDEQRRSSIRNAGAVEFMAPEQHEGRMLFQTDIYSYGVILFELLAGQVPFPLNSNDDAARNNIMLQHLEAPVPNLLEIRRRNLPANWTDEMKSREMQVPHWLIKLVNKCLEKKPENRYADGIALLDGLNQHSHSGGTNAELKAENDRLKELVNTNETPAGIDDSSTIQVSKPLFVLMMVLLVCCMGFSLYTAFFSSNKNRPLSSAGTGADSALKSDTPSSFNHGVESNIPTEQPQQQDTTTKTVPVAPAPAKQPETLPDTAVKHQPDSTNTPSDNEGAY